jgi:hypothetical protein
MAPRVCIPRSNGSKGLRPAEQWLQGSASRGAMAPRVCVPRSNGSKGLHPAECLLSTTPAASLPRPCPHRSSPVPSAAIPSAPPPPYPSPYASPYRTSSPAAAMGDGAPPHPAAARRARRDARAAAGCKGGKAFRRALAETVRALARSLLQGPTKPKHEAQTRTRRLASPRLAPYRPDATAGARCTWTAPTSTRSSPPWKWFHKTSASAA